MTSATNAFANGDVFKKVVKVGYTSKGDLVNDLSIKGREGFGYEMLKKVESATNLRFDYVKVEGPILDALRKGEIDISGLFFKTPEIEEEFLYLDIPMGEETMLLATKGDRKIYYDDPQSIDGKTVATYASNPANELFEKYLIDNNISVEFVVKDISKYLNADTDFYLTNSGDNKLMNYSSALNLGVYPVYIVSNSKSAGIMAEIRAGLQYVLNTEGNLSQELHKKYVYDYKSIHRSLTRAEAEKLKGETFTVGYVDNHKPFTYTNDDGNPDGTIIALMNHIAKAYDFNVEYVPYKLEDEASIYQKVDILVSLIGQKNHDLAGYVLTDAYHFLPMAAMVRKEILDKGNSFIEIANNVRNIGSLRYLNTNFEAFTTVFPHIKFNYYNDFDSVINAYKDSDDDVIIFTTSGITYANTVLDDSTEHIFSADFDLPMYFSFRSGIASEFVPIFNVIFDSLSEKVYSDLVLSYAVTYIPDENVGSFIGRYWYWILLPIAFLMLLSLWYALTVTKAKRAEVQRILDNDSVTGLMSMHKFNELAEEMLSTATRGQYKIVSFDIDMFRSINTYYSVERGTEVLVAIANALREEFKDKPAIFARKFSDNFVILRKNGQQPSVEVLILRTIIPVVQEIIGTNYHLTISAGSYVVTNPKEKLSFMIDYADTARQSGKGSHKTTFKVFDTDMQKSYYTRLDVTYRMDKALEDKDFYIVYQPKVDFNTFELKGAEALVRWKTTDGEMILPSEFIPEFEENGFIAKLDVYVFEEVCKFIEANKDKVNLPIISVNLSALTLLDDYIMHDLLNIATQYNINPEDMELEVTESAMTSSEDDIVDKVSRFKAMGFKISVDDFGAGVSSLNRLGKLNADVLKMDKAFLDNTDRNNNTSIIVESTITLAKNLGMRVVAEGVETHEQVLWLQRLGCDIAQGYYFEKPLDEKHFVELVNKNKIYKLRR